MVQNKIIFAILLLSLIIGACTLTRGHEWGDDFASYIMQAKSILEGQTQEFVEHNSFTVFESSIQIGPAAYPWGYPLILVPAYLLKGLNPLVLKLPGLFFYVGFLACLYLLLKDRLTLTENLLLVSLFAFNPMLLKFLNQILSDIPFLFFSTLGLLLMTKNSRRSTLVFMLLGAIIACAFFIRATGILLLATFLIVEFFRVWRNRTNRELLRKSIGDAILVLGAFGILWVVYALIFPGGEESYFAQYQAFRFETVRGFISAYFQVFSAFFGDASIWKYVYYALFVFFLIGLWMKRKEESAFIVFSVLWLLLLITWPFWQGTRFIFPLLPIFIYFTFVGMKTVLARAPGRWQVIGRGLFNAFWLLIIGVFIFNSSAKAYVNMLDHRVTTGSFDPYSMETYRFIRENTPPQSVIVFFKPRAMRLFTDRDSLMILECDGLPLGDYIVISKKAENSQIPPNQIDECSLPLNTVFENRRFLVYQIQK